MTPCGVGCLNRGRACRKREGKVLLPSVMVRPSDQREGREREGGRGGERREGGKHEKRKNWANSAKVTPRPSRQEVTASGSLGVEGGTEAVGGGEGKRAFPFFTMGMLFIGSALSLGVMGFWA